jgi:transposase
MTSKGAEKMLNDTVGVDVSKDHLDTHRLGDGASRRLANDKRGRKAFVKWLARTPVERVVFEPTGPYHRAFERALGAAGIPFVKVNPRQARRFAEAIGNLAKTDRLDAAMLARMGAMLELKTRSPKSEVLLELKELHLAREALVKDRTAAKNRGKVLGAPLLKRHNARRFEQIKRQITAIEVAILKRLQADPDLAQWFAILTSIAAVSAITALPCSLKCPNSAPSNRGRPQVSQALRLWPDNPVAGPVAPSSAAAGPASARPSTCPPSSRPASIRI